MVFETLNAVSSLKINESKSDGLLRLSGVFGIAGVKNANNRIYDKDNYNQMVETLQREISEAGCPGELEHPNSMNIDLHNVSHKIESIQMNEDGTITGTICLLNTPNGKTAQAIVEGGLPLYISSRGAGSITNEGRVTLSTIKTYDLVGTPGFSQAQLNLDKNQKFENLNESLDDENTNCWAIVTEAEDDVLDDDETKSKKAKTKVKDGDKPEDEPKEKPDDEPEDEPKEKPTAKHKKENNKDTDNKVDMEDLQQSINALTEKVNQLQAGLHVAQESFKPTNYEAIQKWVCEEFGPEFKADIKDEVSIELTESIANGIQDWTINEFTPEIQNWVCEEFAPEVQSWVCEEFAPEVQSWVCEEFAPDVQSWVCEEFAPEVQSWVCEEFAPEVQSWVCEEFAPEVQNWITEEYSSEIQNWVIEECAPVIQNWITEEFSPVVEGWITEEFAPDINSNVSAFLENQNTTRLENIDNMLESLESCGANAEVQTIVAEQRAHDAYSNIYAVTHMPTEYQPSWNLLTETRQNEIIQSTKAYDFTKRNVLENFWAGVDFNQTKINETVQEPVNPIMSKMRMVAESMKSLHPVH